MLVGSFILGLPAFILLYSFGLWNSYNFAVFVLLALWLGLHGVVEFISTVDNAAGPRGKMPRWLKQIVGQFFPSDIGNTSL